MLKLWHSLTVRKALAGPNKAALRYYSQWLEAALKHEWMIDVLSDLRSYALENYLVELAEELEDAIIVASAEIRVRDSEQASIPA